MEWLFAALTSLLAFATGASIGSFLNVVVYRLPAKLSLISPPSRCPHCLQAIRPSDNIPVLGWLRLRGKCRACRSPISPRYPLVEAVTGLLFMLVLWQFQVSLFTLGYWAFFSWLLALALIDWDTQTLPNPLTQSGLVVGLVFQSIWGISTGAFPQRLMVGIVGAVVGIWLLDLVAIAGSLLFGQEAMGAGDAKLAALIGAWLGWKLMLLSGFLAAAIGAFIGGGAIALGLLNRRQRIPFGPLLALGAAIATFYGNAIITAYLQIFFPTL